MTVPNVVIVSPPEQSAADRGPPTLRVWSQDPVQKPVPSGDTRRVLTRFSWPNRMDTRVPFRTSHTLMV